MHESLPGFIVQDEYRLRDLFAYDPAHNPHHRRPPTPRPDFIILQRGKVTALLDAKYRDLWEQPLPRDMLYQLALYALSRPDQRQAVILYPTLDERAVDQRIRIHEPLHGHAQAGVILRPVNLLKMERMVLAPRTALHDREREAWAHQLVWDVARTGTDPQPTVRG